MKKLITALVIISTNAFAYPGDYIDSFWEQNNTLKTLSDTMTVTKGVDIAEVHEMYSRTTKEIRRDYIEEAKSLMQAGATGGEALQMVLAFDDRVYDRRQIATRNMHKTIPGYIRAGIEELYESYEDMGGTRMIEVAADHRADYSTHLTWGMKPGAVIYGILKVTNRNTGTSRTFAGMAKADKLQFLGKQLALFMFHSLHKTRYPLTQRVNGKIVTYSGIQNHFSYGRQQKRAALEVISENCRMRGMRIASRDEMRYLFSRGSYMGGTAMGKNNEWAASLSKWENTLLSFMDPRGTFVNMTNYTHHRNPIKYMCVKND